MGITPQQNQAQQTFQTPKASSIEMAAANYA
jgi:hypothetical protein